ncbi:MAG: DUF1902 domain-containing protein [Candidatus Binataceae bacterium]
MQAAKVAGASRSKGRSYLVKAVWDGEAGVWVATSDDVPGLVTEAANVDALIKKLRVLIPELLDANGRIPRRNGKPLAEVPFEVVAEYHERLRLDS